MLQTRRSFLMSFLSSAALPVLGSGPAGAQGFPQRLTLTPHCDDADELTLAQNEGPFFKLNAPLCHDLAADVRTVPPQPVGSVPAMRKPPARTNARSKRISFSRTLRRISRRSGEER